MHHHALRHLRNRAGLSQANVAERLGTSAPFVSQIERGERMMPAQKLVGLAPVLALSVPGEDGPVWWALARADASTLDLLFTEEGRVGLYPDWMVATVALHMVGTLVNEGETMVPLREGFAATAAEVLYLPREEGLHGAAADTIAVADHVNSVIRRWAREHLPRT